MSSPLRTGLAASWTALHTLQYGLAISGLNGIQLPMTCGNASAVGTHSVAASWLKPCVTMSPAQYGLVVAIFTLGGLVGSLGSAPIVHRLGSVGTLRLSATAVLVGSTAVGLANSFAAMIAGRILIGLGCGLSTTTVPLHLRTLAPANLKRSLGIINQLFIVFGIVLGQSLAFPFARRGAWRYVLAVSVAIAVVQLVGSVWATTETEESEAEEETALLGEDKPLSLWELVTTKDSSIRRGLTLVLVTQLTQQLSGVSGVMYFSTRILSPVFPGNAKVVALGVVLLKIPVTVTPAFLIERLGSRPLMLWPTLAMSVFSLLLAVGINTSTGWLAAASILGFVAAFSVGLGPVTWVVMSEVMPSRARPATSSIGLAVNWTINFVIGASFLPLQQWMSGDKASGEGNIFYVFAGTCIAGVVAMHLGYRSLARIQLD
ncbi:Bifunctional purine biosynthesis protein PurH [Cryptotrichosporon argae]